MTDGSMSEMAALTNSELELIRTASSLLGGTVKGTTKTAETLIGWFTAIMQREKLMGKTNCKKILKKVVEQGGEVQYLRLEEKDREAFKVLAKRYGLLYSPLKDLNKNDDKFEVMFHSSHASIIKQIMEEGSFGELITEDEYLNNTLKNNVSPKEGFTPKSLGEAQTLLELEEGWTKENNLSILKNDLSDWRQDSSNSNVKPAIIDAIAKDEETIIIGQNGSDYAVVRPSSIDVAGTLVAGKSIEMFTKDGVLKNSTHTAKGSIEGIAEQASKSVHIDNVVVLKKELLTDDDIKYLVNNNLTSDQQQDYLTFRECEKRSVMIESPNEFMDKVFGSHNKEEYKKMVLEFKNFPPDEIKKRIKSTTVIPKNNILKKELIVDKLETFQKDINRTAKPFFKQAKKTVQGIGGK